MKRCLLRPASVLVFVFLLLSPINTFSAEFRVTPIRLEFDRGAKSGIIKIINEDDEKLHVQMKAMEWTQDAEGKDQYTETNDIIFFPRIMVIEKNEERILRAGIKIPAIRQERTYRLFIEEIPNPKKAEGTVVAIAIRFGVPIFSRPLKEEAKGEIEKIDLLKGVLSATVKNKGNVHFIINSIDVRGKNAKGEEIFSKELSGWYLLSGASRLYSTPVPQDVCNDSVRLDVEVKTTRFKLNGKLDVDQTMCLP
jgi:fimbrial chaperone protein